LLWLCAVIGPRPLSTLDEFHVETWSVNRKKSRMKNDVVERDGLQTLHLADAEGADRRIEPPGSVKIAKKNGGQNAPCR
jgi:hypothetical protein